MSPVIDGDHAKASGLSGEYHSSTFADFSADFSHDN